MSIEGLSSAAAGMAAQQTRIDAISNDIANEGTTGYKGVRTGFKDLVYQAGSGGTANGVMTGSGARTVQAGRAWSQGEVTSTDRDLDVAINGPGFLRVRTADGSEALTRDGSLQTDAQGRLTTSGGAIVQPPITIPAGAAVKIGQDGTVTGDGKPLGKLALVNVSAPNGLTPLGDNLFAASAASGAPQAAPATTTVQQSALEQSNVDLSSAMTDLIEAQRAYQLTAKAISTQDQLMEIANGVKR